MDRRRKINDSQIRAIFLSAENTSVLSKRYGVSGQMIYLIRSGRVHGGITKGLRAPIRTNASRASKTDSTEALADAIIDKLVKRLRAGLRSRPIAIQRKRA
jgi:hypothetical protein